MIGGSCISRCCRQIAGDVAARARLRAGTAIEAIRLRPRDGARRGKILMSKRRNQHPQPLQDNIFAANPSSTTSWPGGVRLRASNLPLSPTFCAM